MRLESTVGVYAVPLESGNYEIAEISAWIGSDIWKEKNGCRPFDINTGKSTYIGKITLLVDYPKYHVECSYYAADRKKAEELFMRIYPNIVDNFPIADN